MKHQTIKLFVYVFFEGFWIWHEDLFSHITWRIYFFQTSVHFQYVCVTGYKTNTIMYNSVNLSADY